LGRPLPLAREQSRLPLAPDRHGFRLRALIIVLWRGGLRIQEALALGAARLELPTRRCLRDRRPDPRTGLVERQRAGRIPPACAQAGIRRRFGPHQLRHAHAVALAREGVPLNVIQRQLGHANLGTTSIYLQGIDTEEVITTVHARRAPMMSATAGLQL